MALPGVDISVNDGALGSSVSVEDAVMGLVLTAPAASGLALDTPKAIFSLEEAVDLGIDAAFDTANTVDAYLQIKDFYSRAKEGTELWIMLIAQTTTMETACDLSNDIVKALLNAAAGRIKMWGITRVPDGAYTPTYANGFDDDAANAIIKAHALCQEFVENFNPCLAIIGGRDFQGDVGNLHDFKTNSNQWAQIVLGSTTDQGYPAVGFTLGQYANRPVQRKISRLKDGEIGLTSVYLSDGNPIEDYEASMGAIHDKAYVFFKTVPNKTGYYFSSDPSAKADSSDYKFFARGRVIQKALRLLYANLIEEVDDDFEVGEDGYMNPAVLKGYQTGAETAISEGMVGEISGVFVEIDPAQNVLANDTVRIKKVGVRPKAYGSYIIVESLEFNNPVNS